MLLDVAGRAELVERALGHAREDVDHRINPILLGDNSLKRKSAQLKLQKARKFHLKRQKVTQFKTLQLRVRVF